MVYIHKNYQQVPCSRTRCNLIKSTELKQLVGNMHQTSNTHNLHQVCCVFVLGYNSMIHIQHNLTWSALVSNYVSVYLVTVCHGLITRFLCTSNMAAMTSIGNHYKAAEYLSPPNNYLIYRYCSKIFQCIWDLENGISYLLRFFMPLSLRPMPLQISFLYNRPQRSSGIRTQTRCTRLRMLITTPTAQAAKFSL
jgi:hypothetical protein